MFSRSRPRKSSSGPVSGVTGARYRPRVVSASTTGSGRSERLRTAFSVTSNETGLDQRLRHIEIFEKALTDDGALLLKFWLHVPKSEAKKRLTGKGVSSRVAFKPTKQDRFLIKRYDDVHDIAERVLRRTSSGQASWNIVESTDFRYRNATIAQWIIRSLTKRLAEPPKKAPPLPISQESATTVLDQIDLSKTLSKPDYEAKLQKGWRRLAKLSRKMHRKGISSVFVFEGWDAAGKGGVIRRVTAAMDAGHYRVIPIAAPTDEELAHHYLWRFWRNLPRAGHTAIFDRSWYGRVLVERLEGFAFRDRVEACLRRDQRLRGADRPTGERGDEILAPHRCR